MLKIDHLNIITFAEIRLVFDRQHFEGQCENLIVLSFLNSYSYFLMHDSEEYSRIDGFFVDGILLAKLLSLRYGVKIPRVSFDYGSIAGDFFSLCERYSYRVAFIGATETEVAAASKKISQKHPNLIVCYLRDGYVYDSDWQEIIEELRRVAADVIVLGMGAPLQENAAIRLSKSSSAKCIITCGGFFSQTAEKIDYYPHFINKYNLRCIYRFTKHQHVRRKIIGSYPRFLLRFLCECLKFPLRRAWGRPT